MIFSTSGACPGFIVAIKNFVNLLSRARLRLIRRTVQFLIIALIASPLFGINVFHGNLSAAELLGISLTDPLAFLQATGASHVFTASFFGSALLVAGFYFLVGGRTFCAWVCPIHLLTEMGEKMRRLFGFGQRTFALSGIRWSFAATIAISLLAGVPLFEIISPIGITARAIMFKSWPPLLLVLGILVVEIFFARRIWCRSLCPVGGFYSLLGRFSPVRVGFTPHLCTYCGDCTHICPVEEVLEAPLTDNKRQVADGDCTRCGDCIDICPTKALSINLWYK